MNINEMRNEKLNEIIEFAKKNNNIISYTTVVDILKNKDDSIKAEDLEFSIKTLTQKGIIVEQYEGDEGYQAGEIEKDKFIPAEVNISQKPMNIYNLMERLENKEIDLNPGFQRHSNLWSYEKQSQLIESLMLKIPIPAFYFDATDEENWIVIDGLQRLTVFENYLVGKEKDGKLEKRKFEGFQYLKDFNDFTFDDLPRQYIRRIKETPIFTYTVEKGTPDEVVFNIFQRINTGGIALNDQEIRQALYQGKVTELIQELAESEQFLKATQKSIRADRMIDREYVTRFLAFTELDYRNMYKGNIDNFLIKAMKKVNNYDLEAIDNIKCNFEKVMTYCAKIFGKYAFRKYNLSGRRGPINKAIFECWSVCFIELTEKNLDKIVKNKKLFLKKYQILLEQQEYILALKGGDQYSTLRRISMTKEFIKEFI